MRDMDADVDGGGDGNPKPARFAREGEHWPPKWPPPRNLRDMEIWVVWVVKVKEQPRPEQK